MTGSISNCRLVCISMILFSEAVGKLILPLGTERKNLVLSGIFWVHATSLGFNI